LWTLHAAEVLRDELLEQSASDKEPAFRAWAARFSGEQATEPRLARLKRLARDPEPSVRLAVAVAARQLVSGSLTADTAIKKVEIWPVLVPLIQSSADAK